MWHVASGKSSVRFCSFILSPADAIATTSAALLAEQCLCGEDAGS